MRITIGEICKEDFRGGKFRERHVGIPESWPFYNKVPWWGSPDRAWRPMGLGLACWPIGSTAIRDTTIS